jgi:cell wall-associated NlpC family hydrolase
MASTLPDPRVNAYRADLADRRLEGEVSAARFVDGELRQVAQPIAPVRREPGPRAALDTEALLGETVRVFDEAEGFAWVQLERDGYVGYVPSEALRGDIVEATHRVSALATFVYPEPNIKAPPLTQLSLGARIAVGNLEDRFSRLASGGYVVARHLTETGRNARDFVDVAERFIGAPYLWGGRTRQGLDCSGLLQTALDAAGIRAPRDSDMQQATLGSEVLVPDDLEGLERGDLVFWPGHVGIMADSVMLVHANAHHMAVVSEPLVTAAERSLKAGVRIATIKRLAKAEA